MIDSEKQRALRAQYNPDGSDLRNLQLRIFDIMKVIDDICRRHHITYWLEGGTLLGAVRHGGFIPWDDDSDISMPMADYLRFLEICKTQLPEGYVVQNHDTDDDYYLLFGKIRDTKGDLQMVNVRDAQYHYLGAWVDIFPMEPAYPKLSRAINRFSNLNYGHLRTKWKKNLTWRFMNVLRKIAQAITPATAKWNSTYGTNWFYNFPKEMLMPTTEVVFEGHKFLAPADPDAFLRHVFGDYMQIPPTPSRTTHTDGDMVSVESCPHHATCSPSTSSTSHDTPSAEI